MVLALFICTGCLCPLFLGTFLQFFVEEKKGGFLGWLKGLVLRRGPAQVLAALDVLPCGVGGRVRWCCNRSYSYVVLEPNPILVIFFVGIVVVSYVAAVFMVSGGSGEAGGMATAMATGDDDDNDDDDGRISLVERKQTHISHPVPLLHDKPVDLPAHPQTPT